MSIELNGKLSDPLFIFANPPEKKPSRDDPHVLWFEAGKIHTPGIIVPESGQHIFIESGAWVVGAVSAREVEHVQISGYGVMDGSFNLRMTAEEMKQLFTVSNGYQAENDYQRFIEFYDSKNLTMDGLILHNSTTWQVVPINCEQVLIQNLKLIADNPSDDGIDIVRSRQVHVRDCFVRVKDDCVAVKAHLDYPDDCIVEDVLVENCVFWNAAWGNGIEIGFELHSSEVKNVTFRNIDLIHVESGAVFSIHNSDKAVVKDILYEDIRIEDAGHKLIDLAIFRSVYCTDGDMYPEDKNDNVSHTIWDNYLKVPAGKGKEHARYRGKIENIRFRNIFVLEGHFPYSLMIGYDDEHAVRNVEIENLQLYGRRLRNLQELKLHTEYAKEILLK
ncbi:MAG: glycosyl hydrolase family 28 protein [Tannerellaceae bacterium]|nr:glycosyl hydrolase family 28 protein [Tannerellaceae bacterium]